MITLMATWFCLGTGRAPCDAHGTDPKAELASRKHLEATMHGVVVVARPVAQ